MKYRPGTGTVSSPSWYVIPPGRWLFVLLASQYFITERQNRKNFRQDRNATVAHDLSPQQIIGFNGDPSNLDAFLKPGLVLLENEFYQIQPFYEEIKRLSIKLHLQGVYD